ncbi:hypothetical protein LSAT2_026302 [Lamellibrachia satsuma]|nr:hypothetical protein LSAT2_026302 [Lamellibrachia satsuma]
MSSISPRLVIKASAIWFVLFGCLTAQPTTDICSTNDNNDRQASLLEDTHSTLQSIDRRLQNQNDRQIPLMEETNSMLQSIDRRLQDQSEGVKCRRTNDEKHTCYKLVRSKVKRSHARAYCQGLKKGADLVSIESEDEQIFLADLILETKPDCSMFYTSGREERPGVWVWQATGEPFNYTAWSPDPLQPDNSGGICFIWNHVRQKGWMTWDDWNDREKSCFICELP